MFVELKDGREINLDKVTMVEAFNALSYVDRKYPHDSAVSRMNKSQTLAQTQPYNARVFISDYVPAENRKEDGKGWTLIEETPAEFRRKANELLKPNFG